MMNSGVYVHIPFCRQRCRYCDFVSFSGKDGLHEAYKNALVNEIANCAELRDTKLDTIFIGGGTPSVLPPDFIAEILDALGKYNITENAEITIEANPATVDMAKLKAYRRMGINRLSLGLQTAEERLLKLIGRIHSFEEFKADFYSAREVGFENINVDLMFSLPGQYLEDWLKTIETVAELNPEHISAYSLIVEENTEMYRMSKNGDVTFPDEILDRQMYWSADELLSAKGYSRYEFSNFAKKRYASRHNLKYWTGASYIGLGLNAHSYFNGSRYSNTLSLEKYISGLYRENEAVVSKSEAMSEFMFLGLRLTNGISVSAFRKKFDRGIFDVYGREINKHIGQGLLKHDNGRIYLTKKGIDVANIVMSEFV